MSENVSEEFIGLTNKLRNLVSLQLTFRHIGHEALVEIGRQCLNIEVIKLIGYEIVSSDLTSFNTKNSDYFKRLRVLEIRIVRSDENLQDFIDISDDEAPVSTDKPNPSAADMSLASADNWDARFDTTMRDLDQHLDGASQEIRARRG